ncbi:MAG: hypothetical protein ACREBC_09395 [Pyrinomonadaceae bacterium]
MNTNSQSKQLSIHREEGAALITVLLVSTLLLAAGGALILTTSMATTTAADSTAEAQAYYATEAGINLAVNVLRGNSTSATRANFRNVADNPNMNQWFTYQTVGSKNLVVVSASPSLGYDILATDPDGTLAPAVPRRLLLQVNGYGPKGSRKRMEMLVDRHAFDYTPLATILMRGNDDGTTPISPFTIGDSNAKTYSGNDHYSTPTNPIPVFGTTNGTDLAGVTTTVNDSKPTTVSGVDQVAQFDNSDLPSFLQTADNARAFLDIMQATAQANGRYFTSTPASFGTSANPKLTFVDGDADLFSGAGLLIVTGTLTLSGPPSFNGLILVLGKGAITRDGGGNGDIYGGIIIASFERTWPAAENNDPHPFLSPTYTTGGGGNSTVGFDSAEIDRALSIAGLRVMAIREH